MTTRNEKIAELKKIYPVIRVGSDEIGYTDLNEIEYAERIAEWADNLLAKEAEQLAAAQEKQAILDKLGLTENDLKALDL